MQFTCLKQSYQKNLFLWGMIFFIACKCFLGYYIESHYGGNWIRFSGLGFIGLFVNGVFYYSFGAWVAGFFYDQGKQDGLDRGHSDVLYRGVLCFTLPMILFLGIAWMFPKLTYWCIAWGPTVFICSGMLGRILCKRRK